MFIGITQKTLSFPERESKLKLIFEIYIADRKAKYLDIGKGFSASLCQLSSATTGTLLLDSPSSGLQQATK